MRTKMEIVPDYRSAGGGYRISIGTGKTFHAKNSEEIQQAVAHYFKNPGEWCAYPKKCPFCKEAK